ncbi:hypothetical protein ACRN98_23745 [Shewanella oncorhynchi]|uniref:hypothetical protein n=1 Tax=Shewanella TaxID=22 RepID=UPI0021D9B91F|nr:MULTISPECIES: hypothetical protein [unclassified Shewanella]MCU7965177.1 hypothetical protein [Shewanella sp. SW32]MCU7973167.1 hypothetical protein [Shewanella sp. SW29]MCU8036922.1 hypothetical protein [Shewanella sp. SM69]
MHLIAMLVLMILGYAAGENISWLLGLPIMCLGLYMLEVGGKKARGWRQDQEGFFFLLGLIGMVLMILEDLF